MNEKIEGLVKKWMMTTDKTYVDLHSMAREAILYGRTSALDEVRVDAEAYISYYNAIDDKFNQGRHQATNDLIERTREIEKGVVSRIRSETSG
jgi:hypothetical protein